ncbi:MAG: porin [Granulosicoccus sp.]
MKFTKTAIAVAIAGLAATPMMAAADTTLSGLVEIRLSAVGDDDAATTDTDESAPEIGTGDVLFGITSSHELNSGLTGYSSIRLDLNNLSNEGAAQADSVYAGIKGGFGDIRVGEVPNAVEYGQKSTDIFDVAGEVNGGISYTGSFGPATVGLQFSPEENQDMVGVGAKFSVGGFGIGLGAENRNELAAAAAGVSFAFSGASIGAHFWTKEQAGTAGDQTSFAVNAGYGAGAFSGNLTFTALETDGGADQSAVRLDLKYNLGGSTTINSRIQSNSVDGGDDTSAWRIQLSKAF